MSKRAFTLIELIVVVAIFGILAAIVLPVFNRTRCSERRASCQSNLKQLALAWQQYAADNGDKAPALATNGQHYGWSDAVATYGAQPARFHCPSNRALPATNPIVPGYCDYWMNSRLAGRPLTTLTFPAATIVLGEGAGGDARYAVSHLPRPWRNDPQSPAFRHQEGANYAFADGHVKWLRPEKVTVNRPAAGAPTFSVR